MKALGVDTPDAYFTCNAEAVRKLPQTSEAREIVEAFQARAEAAGGENGSTKQCLITTLQDFNLS